jgi:hypothetical protein
MLFDYLIECVAQKAMKLQWFEVFGNPGIFGPKMPEPTISGGIL